MGKHRRHAKKRRHEPGKTARGEQLRAADLRYVARRFEAAVWHSDLVELNGFRYRIEHERTPGAVYADEHFRFYKTRPLVDAYEAFFRRNPVDARNVFELGLWDGGSLAFWFEALKPAKMVGIDLDARGDSPYFRRWVERNGLDARVRTYWKTNQADAARLREIVGRDFDGPLDVVFDDASHLYAPTRASFETLFPLVRPDGLYVIEDWAWQHWRDFRLPPGWRPSAHLTRLVTELVEAAGTASDVVASVHVQQGFVVVRRGPAVVRAPFRLDQHIYRRPAPLAERIATRVLWGPERELLARARRRLSGSR